MEKRPRSKGFQADKLAFVRSHRWSVVLGLAGLGATFLGTALGLGKVSFSSYLIWAMGGVGALLLLASPFPLILNRSQPRLIKALRAEIARGEQIRGELQQEVDRNPFTTAEVAEGPISDALCWAHTNEDRFGR
jgi:hypothetical protein